jgi:uncharacterized damage-inducible protein DinB
MDSKPRELDAILANLANGPTLLRNLLRQIPAELYMEKRIPAKWCIHAHACHLVDVQPLFIDRLERFLREDAPSFIPHIPDGDSGEAPLLKMDLEAQLERFPAIRSEIISIVKRAPDAFWAKRAVHPEYSAYTPAIMIRHLMMHDYLHMYRIEELWIVKDPYLRK